MDIGKVKENYIYYEGFEGEKEVIITLSDTVYHIWDGYFEDIFGNPIFDNNGWSGFTRDYNEFINTFDDDNVEFAIIPDDYLKDALQYLNITFNYGETKDVLNLLISILKQAKKENTCITVRIS